MVVVCVAALGILGAVVPAWAGEPVNAPYVSGSLRKLGRGIANVATCPAELVRTPLLVGRRDGLIAELSVGIVQGVWMMLVRGVTGVFEVASFYAEIPKGFEPLVKPEFVWASGSWAE
ncbi:MAG: exosortase system-associated protein, TIGR04073 family [Candidatus Omnitrophica bacterium]|nr:exosortase system-associated protein, TIGR04073 family [Candidatus Omnitrophota bacterium]